MAECRSPGGDSSAGPHVSTNLQRAMCFVYIPLCKLGSVSHILGLPAALLSPAGMQLRGRAAPEESTEVRLNC